MSSGSGLSTMIIHEPRPPKNPDKNKNGKRRWYQHPFIYGPLIGAGLVGLYAYLLINGQGDTQKMCKKTCPEGTTPIVLKLKKGQVAPLVDGEPSEKTDEVMVCKEPEEICNKDGICNSPTENEQNCKEDCGCDNDNACEPKRGETEQNCSDCKQSVPAQPAPKPKCDHDGDCERPRENERNCPDDCPPPPPPVCNKDGNCDSPTETEANCPDDCGCDNDGTCEPQRGETEQNCPKDCPPAGFSCEGELNQPASLGRYRALMKSALEKLLGQPLGPPNNKIKINGMKLRFYVVICKDMRMNIKLTSAKKANLDGNWESVTLPKTVQNVITRKVESYFRSGLGRSADNYHFPTTIKMPN